MTASASTAGQPQRLDALDGVRGIAILTVMLHHAFINFTPTAHLLDRTLFAIASAGWAGVDLFFVLSGFLITGILMDSKSDPHYYRNFYARRALRIFPLYYGTLFLFYVVFPVVPHPLPQAYIAGSAGDSAWFWVYLTNFKIAANGMWYPTLIPNVFWSLAIEEQFYLLWPVVVLLCSKRTLAGLCCILILLALAFRLFLWSVDAPPIMALLSTPARVDCLAIGALIAIAVRSPATERRLLMVAALSVAAGVAYFLYVYKISGEFGWNSPMMRTVGFTIIGASFGGLLVFALQSRTDRLLGRALRAPMLRTFGKYSYALYLFHGPANTVVQQLTFHSTQAPVFFGSVLPAVAFYTIFTTILSMAIAWLSWNLVESRFLGYQRFFRPAGAPAPELLGSSGHAGVPRVSGSDGR